MTKQTVQTIGDIARLANVSKATVSRALNNSPLINQETRERIQAIARQYNFRLNATARSLSLRQSNTVAFVAPGYKPEFFSAEDFFGLEMLGGVGSGLHSLGYDLLFVHAKAGETAWVQDYLGSGRVDGFIVVNSSLRQEHARALAEASAPFVGWGSPVPGFQYSTVSGDNVTGGRLATEHLISIGRQRIAFLGGTAGTPTVQNRYKGYEQALAAAGRTVVPALVVYGDYSHASGITTMQYLMQQNPEVDAVFVNSDLMAMGAIQAIQAQGKRVPEDIAVVGYDDLSIAVYSNPPLTTIRQNVRLAGELLAQNLVQYIQTGEVTNVILPVDLIVRASA